MVLESPVEVLEGSTGVFAVDDLVLLVPVGQKVGEIVRILLHTCLDAVQRRSNRLEVIPETPVPHLVLLRAVAEYAANHHGGELLLDDLIAEGGVPFLCVELIRKLKFPQNPNGVRPCLRQSPIKDPLKILKNSFLVNQHI